MIHTYRINYATPELSLKESLEDNQKSLRILDQKINKTIDYLNTQIERNKITRN